MPTKTAYMQKLTASRRRDAAARFAWGELSEKERAEIRHAVPRLYEVHNLGDIGVAELLYALGRAGVLDKLGAEGADKPVVWPVETRGEGLGAEHYTNGRDRPPGVKRNEHQVFVQGMGVFHHEGQRPSPASCDRG